MQNEFSKGKEKNGKRKAEGGGRKCDTHQVFLRISCIFKSPNVPWPPPVASVSTTIASVVPGSIVSSAVRARMNIGEPAETFHLFVSLPTLFRSFFFSFP